VVERIGVFDIPLVDDNLPIEVFNGARVAAPSLEYVDFDLGKGEEVVG
jgi:hypothetical protein